MLSETSYQDGSYIGRTFELSIEDREIVISRVSLFGEPYYYEYLKYKVMDYEPSLDMYLCEFLTADENDGKHFYFAPFFVQLSEIVQH